MKRVFADTGYFVAQLNPRDKHRKQATDAAKSLQRCRLVTSEMVFVELLSLFAERGDMFRNLAAALVERMRSLNNVEVVPQTSDLFRHALELYKERPDKGWSMTDCASFCIMKEKGIDEALAHDHHFEQAGFRALLRDKAPSE